MSMLVDTVLLVLSLAALVPALVLFVELMLGASPPPTGVPALPPGSPRVRIAVLMPAHDEEAGIAEALRPLLPQLAPGDRALVVADNCSDATAEIARGIGAEVVERFDEHRRGKGYALDFGMRALAASPPDVVIVVDADCVVEPGSLALLAARCRATGRPVQALYSMKAPAGAPIATRIAAFAWRVKNWMRPAGAARLGWPCPLMGSGMAFPWPVLAGAPLASGHLVEDMQLGIALTRSGQPPLFCPEAQVGSVFPADRAALRTQRTRWEQGHLAIIASASPHLLLHALARRDAAALAMLLDLTVPPLAAFLLLLVVWAALMAAAWALGAWPWPLVVVMLALALSAIGLARAWHLGGRSLVRAHELAAFAGYVAAKIPIYAGLFVRRQTQWIRTQRDERKP